MIFFHIEYSFQVRCIAHACTITFSSVPHLSNYGHLYLLWYFREEWVDFIHIWCSNQVPRVADACKISYGCIWCLSNYDNIFLNFICLLQYCGKEWVDFVHIWYSNQPNRDLMHVKNILALCQNVAFTCISTIS